MKLLPAFLVLCSLATQAYAQEEPLDTLPSTIPNPNRVERGQPAPKELKSANEQGKQEATATETEFKLHIFLNEPVGTHASLELRNIQIQVQKPVVESKMIDGQEIKETRYVTVQVVKAVESVTAGATIIDCDAMEVQVKADDDAQVSYEFEIQGHLRLRNGNSKIGAQSAKLTDGKLTLTDVTAITGGINMKSSEVVIDLNVNSLRIGDYQTDPIRSNLVPIPNNGYAPTPDQSPAPFNNGTGSDDFAPAFPGATIPPASAIQRAPEKATLRSMPVY